MGKHAAKYGFREAVSSLSLLSALLNQGYYILCPVHLVWIFLVFEYQTLKKIFL